MNRLVALILLALAATASAQACDMRTSTRAGDVATYVERGRVCLNAPAGGFSFDTEMERAFVARINRARSFEGLAPLTVRAGMLPAARFHSLDMGTNDFFGHKTPRGKFHAARISAFDRTMLPKFTAENVAKEKQVCENRWGDTVRCKNRLKRRGLDAVIDLHSQLMNSPGHRANILSTKATHVSVGVARRGGEIYVTQLFATPVGTLNTPLPLRLRAGSKVEATAIVPNWTVKRLALMRDNSPTDLQDGSAPRAMKGDYTLAVRAERSKGEAQVKRRKIIQPYEFIYLPGPSFSALPATESGQSGSKAS